jgi:hypothetical protein
MIRSSRACLAVILACIALPALAARPKPDATIRTRAIEANVYLGARIKADPALAANCLAEGRRWLTRNAADAASMMKEDPQFFRRGGWSFERHYKVSSAVAGRYVSIVRSDFKDTHGAHPNTDVNTILWDDTARKRISIRPFFKETIDGGPTMRAMQKAVIAALKIEKKKRDIGETSSIDWFKDLKPTLLKIGAVTLAPSTEAGKSSGLTFYYPPYAVGPYVDGEYIVFVPWETLKPYLSAEGARIFGGHRPGDDRSN